MPGPPENNGRIRKETVRYGRGTLVHSTIERWGNEPPRCPLKLPGACGTYTISSSGKSPEENAWLGGTLPVDAEKSVERGPLPAPHAWIDFSSGRDAVYALRKNGRDVDRIDDQGKVTLFATDPASAQWNKIQIYEIGEHTLLARQHNEGSSEAYWEIADLSAPDSNGVRKPGAGNRLPMKPVIETRPNAQGARTATRAGSMAMFGSPLITRLDAKDAWAMVWLEVIPPPYRWPSGKPQKLDEKKEEKKAPKKGSKNGCGGPPSRGLDDRSVGKRAHITRFSGASVVDDTVAWTSSDLDPYGYQLKFQKEGDKITVEPPPKKAKSTNTSPRYNRRSFGDYDSLELSPAEHPEYATFDPDAGEGLALLRTSDQFHFRRFDANGAWLSASTKQELPSSIKAAANVKGRWYALINNTERLVELNGTAEPINITLSHEYLLDVYQREDKLRLVSAHEGILWESTLNEKNTFDPPVRLGDLPSGMRAFQLEFRHLKGSPPMVAGLIEPRGDGELRVAWRLLTQDATWTKHDPFPDGTGEYYRTRFHHLREDLAVVYREDKKRFITWLRAGKTSPAEEMAEEPSSSSLMQGILLPGGDPAENILIPEAPGPLQKIPELAGLEEDCSVGVPTKPDTVVFFCAQAMDEKKAGYRAGLRVYKRPAP